MNLKNRLYVLSLTVVAVLFLSVSICSAKNTESNVLFLMPGHSQTITFPLKGTVVEDLDKHHECYFLMLGDGRVSIRVNPATAIGEYAQIIYGVIGFAGFTPVIDWAYNSESISASIDVTTFGLGMIFTGIIYESNSPVYPVIMSMTISYQ